MDRDIEAVLAGYDQRAAKELALMQEITLEEMLRRVDEFLIPIGPDAGRLLNVIIKSSQARTIVELGTAYGYSTIFLAEAARACQGKVISIDVNADKQRHASEQLEAAGLGSFVEFVTGDAREVVTSLAGPFDFVLIDLWKDLYISCFDLVHPKLSEGAFVAADNILHPELFRPEMGAYRQHVRRHAGFETILLPVGNGIELSRYAGKSALTG